MPDQIYRSRRHRLRVLRDDSGVLHVHAEETSGLYYGLGYAHAHDRGLQLLVMRLLVQGRLAEVLDPAMVDTDRFFRRIHCADVSQADLDALTPRSRAIMDAYTEGLNARLRRSPWELRLMGYRPEPWRAEDTIAMMRAMGYIGLAQSQGEIERLLLDLVQAGVDKARLEALFGALDGLDLELVKKVKLVERVLPDWSNALSPVGSNNWAVAPRKTASGAAHLASDPHLEVDRLPAVWCEVVLRTGNGRYVCGAGMPGIPAVVVGRTNDLSWGVTYTYMDGIDSWIEHCRDGQYLRDGQWQPFRQRHEVIKLKGGTSVQAVYYENEHGTLEGEPWGEGYRLSTRWASARAGARSINAMVDLFDAPDVVSGQKLFREVETAFNWVLADRQGNIGYQMSGLCPKRKSGATGLIPLPGWDSDNDWRGFESGDALPTAFNPEEGFITTANQNLNHLGTASPINMDQGSYRADRIAAALAGSDRVDVEFSRRLQLDTGSEQAERFMEILAPMVPDTPNGRVLLAWDRRYEEDSLGAYVFEVFYRGLFDIVFGEILGRDALDELHDETSLLNHYYVVFDRVLLSETSPWFGTQTREDIYRQALRRALARRPEPWGQVRQVMFTHMLFGEKLPSRLGFDRGPYPLVGGRATPRQGQILRVMGRDTTFAPSYRFIADFADDCSFTALPGGSSDRRTSKWYANGIEGWLAGRLKRLYPDLP